MNMFKKNGGFTLVELIVVIAILAILAGVAIPAYNGYIKKAQDASILTELDAVATAAQASKATVGAVNKITVSGTTISIDDVTVTAADTDFVLFYGSHEFKGTLANTSYASGATWTRNDPDGTGPKKAGWNAN